MRFIWFLLGLMHVMSAQSHPVDKQDLSAFIVEMSAPNNIIRSQIASIIHIDSIQGDRIYSVVNSSDLRKLQQYLGSYVLSWEILQDEISPYFRSLGGAIEFPVGEEKFHTYDELSAGLKKLAKDYAALVTVFSIGKSLEGRELWAIKIGQEPSDEKEGDKPAIAFMGTHHAREHVSTEVPLQFAHDLLAQEATDSEIKELLKTTDIYIIPLVNPDGAMYDIEGRRYKWWRKNRKHNNDNSYGVDLNRNYGFGWGTGGSSSSPSSDIYMGSGPFSEPETQAIRDFFKAHRNIKIALSFHTFSELILYPWGGRNEGVGGQDEAIFKKMAEDMAAMNNYRPMQSSELYIASGDTCDWLYGELKVFCFTFELSPSSMWDGGFYPGADVIDKVYQDNLEPMLYLSRHAKNPSQALAMPE
jgi:carboxypeptidase T